MKNKFFVPLFMTTLISLFACTTSSSESSVLSSSPVVSSVSSVASSEEESSVVSSVISSESSSVVSSSEIPSSTGPVESLVEKFNYQFDAAFAGDPAINAPEEGEGFLITSAGVATTINGSLEPAAAPNWTFTYGAYDLGMGEFEMEAKVRYLASTNNTAVFAMRTCYDGCYDVQFSAKNNVDGWQGVQIYQAGGGLVAQHDGIGGLITDGSLVIVPDTDYVFKMRSVIGLDSNALVSIFVNDVKVIEVAGLSRSTLNANAKHGIGASQGSWLNIDYFKGSSIELV